jgi:hypothetical protein
MSTKSAFSLSSLKDKDKIKDTIPCRIEIIQELLRGKNLKCLVDFDNSDTEYFLPTKDNDNASGDSYDTRIVLKKRSHDFTNIISQIGGKLKYMKSGTTGHTFKGESVDNFGTFEYGVKVVAYPKKERYGGITDIRRPENAELMMIKLLSYFIIKRQTPHVVLPIGTFDTNINIFVDLIDRNVVNCKNDKYNDFIQKYKEGLYFDTVSILISEWANRGDLLDFLRKNYEHFSPVHWKVVFFQILSVLAVIQSKYPSFRHNDLKANNVLIHKIAKQNGSICTYKVVRSIYKVPNIGYHIKLWDFDFACIPGIVDNKKVECQWTKEINVTPVQNRYYDIHYFFNTLIKKGFCPEIMTSNTVPQEVKDFINRVVPKKYQKTDTEYIHKRGRILTNDEYITPDDLLKHDPFFEEFRINGKDEQHDDKYKHIKKSFTKGDTKKSNTLDLTKFLRSESPDNKTNINITKLLKGGDVKKKKEHEKVKSGKDHDHKPKKINKKKSRTISSEIKELDPDLILKYSTSS